MPSSTIDPAAAALAALVAAQLMEALAYLQRALGFPVRQDIFDEGGSILRAPRRWRRVAGWAGHASLAARAPCTRSCTLTSASTPQSEA